MVSAEPIAGEIELLYNADGQRVAKASTGFLYNYKHLLHETDEIGGEITKTYTSTTDDEFGDLISEDGSELYHQFDAQANTNALLDEAGNVEARQVLRLGQIASGGDSWAYLSVPQWSTMSVLDWFYLSVDTISRLGTVGQKQYYWDTELNR